MKKLSKRNAAVENSVVVFDACSRSCISLCGTYKNPHDTSARENTMSGIRRTK